MYGIDVLINEHEQILRFTGIIRRYLVKALEGEVLFQDEVLPMIEFIRNYSDAHHHGKEEDILFRYMLADLGPRGGKNRAPRHVCRTRSGAKHRQKFRRGAASVGKRAHQ